jgi:SAM-dependent methyltransferase
MADVDAWEPTVEHTRCDLCGADDPDPVMYGEDRRCGTPGRFRVVRCRRCRLVYVDPRPDSKSLGRYYGENYPPHAASQQYRGALAARIRAWVFRPSAGRPLAEPLAALHNTISFRAFVAASRGGAGRVLDVGCGRGDYLAAWQRLGWEVEGVESSPAAAEHARRLLGSRVHVGLVEDLELPQRHYDVVTMSHSLEHMRSPTATLAQLRRCLAGDGRLVIMVPNFASWDRRLFREGWYGLEVPRHLYHFEPDTLRAVLARAGFTVEHLGGSAHPDALVRSVRWALQRPHPEAPTPKIARAAVTALMLLPALLRRSASLWTIARRTPDARPD